MHDLSFSIAKLGLFTGSGLLGLASIDTQTGGWVVGLERMGSFALVAAFVLGTLWLASKALPILLGMFERTKDQFVEELKLERMAREKSIDAFREMLHVHRSETVAAIKEQTGYVARLVDQLEERPCQIKK